MSSTPDKHLVEKIALTLIPRVGAILSRNLVSYCGSVSAVFEASKNDLLRVPSIGEEIVKFILDKSRYWDEAEKEAMRIQKHGIRTCFYLDKDYPQRLKNLEDAPILLYIKGEQANLNAPRTIGIVGTRLPTDRGRSFTTQLVQDLAAYGATVVSGLAYGIDITAHRACIEANVPTLGCVGHGLGTMYPNEHAQTAKLMAEQGGGIVSEYFYETDIKREHFPMRNRVIAGLCDALVVVETDLKGGSIITANIANEYQRDVFALPGRPSDQFSRGCNLLIKSHRASLIESVADLAYTLRWDKPSQSIQTQLFVELTDAESKVMQFLRGHESLAFDQLLLRTEYSTSILSATLLDLEFKGMVKSLPGKRYMALVIV